MEELRLKPRSSDSRFSSLSRSSAVDRRFLLLVS